MRKITLLLLSTILLSSVAYAGGHIFGGHKTKTANPNGVHSIGVHVCGSLECPPVRITQGSCTGDHMSKHWGVCVCDKGYVASGEHCDPCPAGQFSDGINGCKIAPKEPIAPLRMRPNVPLVLMPMPQLARILRVIVPHAWMEHI